MKEPAHQAWGQRLLTFRQRRHYRQGELADALSFIRLPGELSLANPTTGDNTTGDNSAGVNITGDNIAGDNTAGDNITGDNITIQNYELSRFEQGHRCPRPRRHHLALIYGLVHLECIETVVEANEWLALADQRPLNPAEQALIFRQQPGATPVSAPPRADLEIDARQLQSFDTAHRTAYLNRILHQYEYLPLQGLTATARSVPLAPHQRIGLLDVYIELDTTAKIESFDEAQNRPRMKPLSALQALVRSTRAVLLGTPGSGKSTFVNYLAYCLANHHLYPDEGWLHRHLPTWPDAWRTLLPIPITLREVAAWVQAAQIPQRNSRLLLDYLQSWLHQRILDEYYFVLKDHLRRGQALLLLDGLDELPDDEKVRRQIKEMIADLPAAFPDTPILVTCRVLSYRTSHWQLDEQTWPVFELAALTDRQIGHFIDDWYQLMATMGVVQTGGALSDKLQQAVLRPDLLRLARNPLLLMVMALVHTHKGQLPDARALLFAAVV
ncbi:MAG: NACHT domain-containing protein, partial [Caldilineaceae bacterium]